MFRPNEEWDDAEFPLAYFITLRTYGTWLHGDERGSISRHRKNTKPSTYIEPNLKLKEKMESELKHHPVRFDKRQRGKIGEVVKDFCDYRSYFLHAQNARTNHVHIIVRAEIEGEVLAKKFKSRITKELRLSGLIEEDVRPWARGESCRRLWKQRHLAAAIEYVLYGQGDVPFDFGS